MRNSCIFCGGAKKAACVNQNTMTRYEMNFLLAIHFIPTHSYRLDVTPAMHGVIKFVVVLKDKLTNSLKYDCIECKIDTDYS